MKKKLASVRRRKRAAHGRSGPRPHLPPPGEATDLAPVVGAHAVCARARLSLERLAQISGVSRAMLGQIELGQSAPTINVLWKIARALEVTFSALISARTQSGALVLRSSESKILTSKDRSFSSRALFPFDEPRRVEFYELRLQAGSVEDADAHPPGTSENLVVTAGTVEIDVAGDTHRLEAGDSILFEADTPTRIATRPRRVGDVPRDDVRRRDRLAPPARTRSHRRSRQREQITT